MQLKIAVTPQDHAKGVKDAPLELVEYGDYECSSCGQSYLVVKELQQVLGKDLRFIFRNFPLTDEHPNAFGAAMAAEAAGCQNKFWEMFDLLFQNQDKLNDYDFLNYAKELGLNVKQFNRDIRSTELQSIIEGDYEGGVNSGVTGTPNFYINGKKYDGDWGIDGLISQFKKILE